MKNPSVFRLSLIALLLVLSSVAVQAAPLVVSSCGNITPRVSEFRALLGGPSNVATPPNTAGRREINWDGVPAAVTNTSTFAGNFFNTNSPRGLVMTTPGTGFRVSDNNFSDVNAGYSSQFAAFSPTKTFAPIGSNVLDLTFFIPGTTNAATVSGFGVVFSDVDLLNGTRMEFFSGSTSLGTFFVPVRCDAVGHSFLGVLFPDGQRVSRVRITAGQVSVSASANDVTAGGASDVVVMDDFLYSEPILAASASAGVLTAVLLGTSVIPGPGDADGTGFAVVTLDPATGNVGYAISVQNISPPSAAHIHIGASNVAGSIVINFAPTFTNNVAVGTVTASQGQIIEILANPAGFYVDVHNADFPGGAVRGQLRVDGTASTRFTFPVVARVPGANNTAYRTDVRLLNLSGAPAEVLVQFYAGGGVRNAAPSASGTITIGAGEQKMLDDVLKSQFNLDNAVGAIQLFSSRPIIAVARIYNDQRAVNQGTFGQFVQGADDRVARQMGGALPGLSNSPIGGGAFRTNIGWFNAGSTVASVTLRAYDPNSTLLSTVTVTVPPFSQLQQGSAAIFSSLGTRENFYVTYTVDMFFDLAGFNASEIVSTLFVYASVVDNINGDAIYIPAQADSNLLSASKICTQSGCGAWDY